MRIYICLLLVFCCCMIGIPNAVAKTTVKLGDGILFTSSDGCTPFASAYHDNRTQILYTAAEINQSGVWGGGFVRSIAFEVEGASEQVLNSFKIKMKHTLANSLVGFEDMSSASFVYGGSIYEVSDGWNTFLTSGFIWDGRSNIIIEVSFDNVMSSFSSAVRYTSKYGSIWSAYSNSSSGVAERMNGGVGASTRPNLKIAIEDGVFSTTTPSVRKNYIQTYSPQTANGTWGEVLETIEYIDGLGRPEQAIQVGITPLGKDLIQPFEYNRVGKEVKKYLPYQGASSNGKYMSEAIVEQATFYNSRFGSSDGANAFSETIFEDSPLNRVLAKGAPGVTWQPDKDVNGNPTFNDQTVKIDYGTNTAFDVLLFQVQNDRLDNFGGDSDGVFCYYKENDLYKNIIKDENWVSGALHTTEEYKDKQGRIVLKRSYVDTSSVAGVIKVTPVETYYVYDDYGLLRYVLPPKAVANLKGDVSDYSTSQNVFWFTGDETITTTSSQGNADTYIVDSNGSLTLHPGFTYTATSGNSITITTASLNDDLCYSYKYDRRKRMIEKKIPGAAAVYLVYDNRDRLVATQDGEMRNEGKWLFTKYDALNRPVMTGLLKNNLVTQSGMQGKINAYYVDVENNDSKRYYEERSEHIESVFNYTVKYSFPSDIGENEILTMTYYDTNMFTSGRPFYSEYNISDESYCLQSTKGQVTGTRVKVLDGNEFTSNAQWLVTSNYYDSQYRVVQSIVDLYPNNNGNNYVVSSANYDFVGNVEKTLKKQFFEGSTTTVEERFEYDHAGRLKKQWHSIDGSPEVLLAENTYNELGELIKKDLGNGVQQMNYKYNIRGWLTQINNPDIANAADQKFAMRLYYNTFDMDDVAGEDDIINLDGVEQPQYNGNISAMKWRTPVQESIGLPGTQQAYAYYYDGLNRLTDARYGEGTALSEAAMSNAFTVSGIKYDLNGNIRELNRNREVPLTADIYKNITSWGKRSIDQLTYDYKGNQLLSVNEGLITTEEDFDNKAIKDYGFKDGNTGSDDYSYDLNGNMIVDKNKGLTSVEYNHLNLPRLLTGNNNGTIETITYIYDANGQKLMKRNTKGEETYYAGSFIYQGSSLDYILHSEGKYKAGGTDDGYQYNLKDHLGNVRLVVKADVNKTVLDQTDYYPFGMSMNMALHAAGQKNLYKYNGKELQEDQIGGGNLDWYDYGARFYDPSLGRFHTVDPLTDFYSGVTPYVYAVNNPVTYIDVYGLGPLEWWRALKKGTMRLMGYAQKGNYKAKGSNGKSNVEFYKHPRRKSNRKGGKPSFSPAEPSSKPDNPTPQNEGGGIIPPPIFPIEIDISYRSEILTMQKDRKFGGDLDDGNTFGGTKSQEDYNGYIFKAGTDDLKYNLNGFDKYINNIVTYLINHPNKRVRIVMRSFAPPNKETNNTPGKTFAEVSRDQGYVIEDLLLKAIVNGKKVKFNQVSVDPSMQVGPPGVSISLVK